MLRARADFYKDAHPGAEDILLVIEVAEASAETDRRVKVPLYAKAAICEVWLVDLTRGAVEVYRQLSPQGYQIRQRNQGVDQLTPAFIPRLTMLANEILL